MKRGKGGDEKVVGVGPMFPRLHVSDTEKGGPRAPPRNKMALYEHFTVPFQRSNPRFLPLDPNPNPSSNTVPPLPPPSSQGNVPEGSYIFPVHLHSETPTHRAESCISHQSDGANSDTSLAQLKQRTKEDEDDIRAYKHSRIGQSNDRTLDSFNVKKLTPMGSRNFYCLVAGQNDGDTDQTQFGSPHVDVRSESKGHLQVSQSSQQQVMSVKNISTGEVIDSPVRQAKVIPDQEDQDCSVSNISRLHQGDVCLQQECMDGSLSNDIEKDDGLLDSTRDMDNRNTLVLRGCLHSTTNQTSPLEATNGTEYHDTNTGSPMQKGCSDESDGLSKMSTVENLSSLKLSPDDIARILGQKLFWKARRKITNQQRVLAVQVFELHRLIKVQQVMAGSPDLLFEDAAFIGKFPLEGSPKSLSLEVVVEPPQNLTQQDDDSEKLNHKMECFAENAVGKTSFPSLSNHIPFYGNPHRANVASDERMASWCFNSSPGHQWLVPVMSPSEGLVYKPYPAPGFTRTMYGGYGPFGQGPLEGNFTNHAYGVTAFHQAIAVSPFIPPSSYGFFPSHGMPAMNQAPSGSAVEQVNRFAAQGSHGQNGHSFAEGANFNTRNESSCNLPVKKNGATSRVAKFKASKERELQGSTASSPSEMAQGIRKKIFAEGRDAHCPPLMARLVSEEVLQSTQVIKVVPHNPRSATESAARIFQSIQQERKQYDLV